MRVRRPCGANASLTSGRAVTLCTQGDNSNVVPTDTVKNTTYVVAKQTEFTNVEEFGLAMGKHFLGMYPHVSTVHCRVTQTAWERLEFNGKSHTHAWRKGTEEQNEAYVKVTRSGGVSVTSVLKGLTLLKTTGTEFLGFHECKYTTLKKEAERLMGTTVHAEWTYKRPVANYAKARSDMRAAVLDVFANVHSLSVQHTMAEVAKVVFASNDEVANVQFDMPNIHNIPFAKLEQFGFSNNNEILTPIDEPHGTISAKFEPTQSRL